MISLRFLILPLLAAAGIGLAVYTVQRQNKPVPAPPIPIAPNASPFVARLAGVGTVEPASEIVKVGSPFGAVIEEVSVAEGQAVHAGDPLFTLDRREPRAKLTSAEAELRVAKARLLSVEARPRVEDVRRAEARLAARQASLADAQSRLKRLLDMGAVAVVTANERPTLEYNVQLINAQVAEAQADLAQVRRGAYPEEREEAESAVALATARRDEARTALDRMVVKSPIDGTVLAVDVRAGAFAPAGPQAPTLIALGSLTPLHVRVEIDELDAWRFDPKGKAIAMLRGSEKRQFPLRFIRIVPQVHPKRTVTGDMGERMDTRVVQVIYAVDPPAPIDGSTITLLPGQVLDVFIEKDEDRAQGSGVRGQ